MTHYRTRGGEWRGCIGITDSNNHTEYKQARFSSFTEGLNELCDWLAKYNCTDVCMESTEILRLSDKYEAALNLIRTVPKFDKDPMTAIQVLSEIGCDMSVFPTDKHLVSWAGCCPRNDKSDRKIKSTRISQCTHHHFLCIIAFIKIL